MQKSLFIAENVENIGQIVAHISCSKSVFSVKRATFGSGNKAIFVTKFLRNILKSFSGSYLMCATKLTF